MTKQPRVKRPIDELKQQLVEQLQLLRHSCQAFDSGLEAAGKYISLNLRVLLHDKGKSRSLLDQLGFRSGRYLTSVSPLNPKNLGSECNLVVISHSNGESHYLPKIATPLNSPNLKSIPFVNWWNDPVLKDNKNRTFCRRELVLNVADTDGGAHVDPELEEAYMEISRKNSLAWFFGNDNTLSDVKSRPELACMRQIAHELLCTINKNVLEFSQYAQPIIPVKNAHPQIVFSDMQIHVHE